MNKYYGKKGILSGNYYPNKGIELYNLRTRF